MKKFDNYIIEKPCDSNSDKLQKISIIESLVDDILQFSIRINNSVGEIFLLQPISKEIFTHWEKMLQWIMSYSLKNIIFN